MEPFSEEVSLAFQQMLYCGASASRHRVGSSSVIDLHPSCLLNERLEKIQTPLGVSLRAWSPLSTLPLSPTSPDLQIHTPPHSRPWQWPSHLLRAVASLPGSASSNGNSVSLTPFSLLSSFPFLVRHPRPIPSLPLVPPLPSLTTLAAFSLSLPETGTTTPQVLLLPQAPPRLHRASPYLGTMWERGNPRNLSGAQRVFSCFHLDGGYVVDPGGHCQAVGSEHCAHFLCVLGMKP